MVDEPQMLVHPEIGNLVEWINHKSHVPGVQIECETYVKGRITEVTTFEVDGVERVKIEGHPNRWFYSSKCMLLPEPVVPKEYGSW